MNDILHQKIERLDEEVRYLESNRERFLATLHINPDTRRLVERSVYLCAEMAVDLADFLIVDKGLPNLSGSHTQTR